MQKIFFFKISLKESVFQHGRVGIGCEKNNVCVCLKASCWGLGIDKRYSHQKRLRHSLNHSVFGPLIRVIFVSLSLSLPLLVLFVPNFWNTSFQGCNLRIKNSEQNEWTSQCRSCSMTKSVRHGQKTAGNARIRPLSLSLSLILKPPPDKVSAQSRTLTAFFVYLKVLSEFEKKIKEIKTRECKRNTFCWQSLEHLTFFSVP